MSVIGSSARRSSAKRAATSATAMARTTATDNPISIRWTVAKKFSQKSPLVTKAQIAAPIEASRGM